MKKFIFLVNLAFVLFILLSNVLLSQNTNTYNWPGNGWIGIQTTQPNKALNIHGFIFDSTKWDPSLRLSFGPDSLRETWYLGHLALITPYNFRTYSKVTSAKDLILQADTSAHNLILTTRNDSSSIRFTTTSLSGGNDSERVIITNRGNIGINQHLPMEKLDVNGKIKSSSLAGIGDRMVTVSANGTLKYDSLPVSFNGNYLDSNDFIGSINNKPLIFKTNDTARLIIGNDGSIQIPNFDGNQCCYKYEVKAVPVFYTYPGDKLSSHPCCYPYWELQGNEDTRVNLPLGCANQWLGTKDTDPLIVKTDEKQVMIITGGNFDWMPEPANAYRNFTQWGNVGIGLDPIQPWALPVFPLIEDYKFPIGKLDINVGASNHNWNKISFLQNNNNPSMRIYRSENGDRPAFPWAFEINSGGSLLIKTGATANPGTETLSDKLTILSNGNVGVNISGPTEKLHIDGKVRISDLPNTGNYLVTADNDGVLGKTDASLIISDAWQINGNSNTDFNNFIGTTSGR